MEDNLFEKKVSSEQIFKGKILTLFYDKVELPNGIIGTREKVSHPGAVAVVPVNKKDEIILVKQYRYPVEKILIEIPAGKLDNREPALECAERELHEEAGVVNGALAHLATIYTSPGFSDEKMDIFIATEFEEKENNPDQDEFLHIFKAKISECLEMIENGTISDAKSIIGIMLARDYLLKKKNEQNK
jgi:ADP-ribose pyrophosphatase